MKENPTKRLAIIIDNYKLIIFNTSDALVKIFRNELKFSQEFIFVAVFLLYLHRIL